MSGHWLRYAPSDPWFRPTPAGAEAARALLSSFLPQAEAVSIEFFDGVQFIDPGANWSGVLCPACGADAVPWWADAMSACAGSGFASLEAVARCCGAKVSLNDLHYVWPAAFGCFVLEAMNPNAKGLSAAQVQALERELGCAVREVARHL
jgi:hypothetical protein